MNLIDSLFQKLRSANRQAFIPFVTAGDPDLDTTKQLVLELVKSGASLVEIGFPYSDPIADGSVIQASYTRALSKGIHIEEIFAATAALAKEPLIQNAGIPLVGMVSYSLVYRRGAEKFLDQAQASGLSGAIVPDMPLEESEELGKLAAKRDFKLIQLVTPTTPEDRAKRIAQSSSGFLYCVSITGITGERDQLPHELLDQLGRLRKQTDLPLCVGFGINKPEHVQMLREVADGVIVGSAIVRQLENRSDRPKQEMIQSIGSMVKTLVKALR